MKLFAAGQRICAERGPHPRRHEVRVRPDARTGKLVVIDEIHTPDSSRFWQAATYAERFDAGQDPEPLDKDFVRRWYIAQGYKGDGDAAGAAGRRARRRGRALHRGVRADHRRARSCPTPSRRSPRIAQEPRASRELTMKATVLVRLKTEVLDPQGDAVRRALGKLGFEGVKGVRVGKIIEIEIDDAARQGARPRRAPRRRWPTRCSRTR